MARRLYATGVVICLMAVAQIFVVGGLEDFRHSLRYGALLFVTGAVVITIDRWGAIIPHNFNRPRLEKLRRVALCTLFLPPITLIAWSLDAVSAGVWMLVLCLAVSGLYWIATLRRHGKIRDAYTEHTERRVAQITRGGAAPPPPPPPGALPPGTKAE